MPTERTIAVKISFLGCAYHGFQRQKNALSVQQVIEQALFKILGEPTVIFGCSRTDTGVSAREYVFHFKTQNRITEFKLKGALNHFLPDDIVVLDCVRAPDSFHARYDTVQKEYEYIVHNTRQKDPFCVGRALIYGITHLDEKLLDAAAQAFVGRHDFSAFCSSGGSANSHVRTVTRAAVRREGDDVIFSFAADGFLYNMVRIMVGTLIAVNEGKIVPDEINDIIKSRDRKKAGKTAAACGLYLKSVTYKDDLFKKES